MKVIKKERKRERNEVKYTSLFTRIVSLSCARTPTHFSFRILLSYYIIIIHYLGGSKNFKKMTQNTDVDPLVHALSISESDCVYNPDIGYFRDVRHSFFRDLSRITTAVRTQNPSVQTQLHRHILKSDNYRREDTQN